MKNRPYKLLKTLLLAPLLLALAGCVTYYYPAVDTSDGVYYAADDPAYAGSSGDYVSVRYYPWWSLDYFYLGSGYYGSGFSFGLSYGYPTHPWAHYPHRWYYDPWYYSYWYAPVHYHYSWFGYAYHNPYWHVRYRGHHGGHYRGGGDHHHGGGRHGRDRYAGGGGGYPRGNDPGPDSNPPRDYDRGRSRPDGGSYAGTGAGTRRVSVAPDGASSDRGMVVVSRDGGKWSRSRLEPIKSRNGTTVGSERDEYRGRERPGGGSAESYADIDRGAGLAAYTADARRSISRVAPETGNQARVPAASNGRGMSPPPSRVVRLPEGDAQARAVAAARASSARLQPAGVRPAAQSAPPARFAPPPRSSGPRMEPPRSVRSGSSRASRSVKAASPSPRRASSKDDR
jgi:hypothetical protein